MVFAAGCALCGADLDPRRHQRSPGLLQRLGSAWAALRTGPRPRGLLPRWRADPRQFAGVVLVSLLGCAIVGGTLTVLAYVASALLG